MSTPIQRETRDGCPKCGAEVVRGAWCRQSRALLDVCVGRTCDWERPAAPFAPSEAGGREDRSEVLDLIATLRDQASPISHRECARVASLLHAAYVASRPSSGEDGQIHGVCFLFIKDGCVLMERCPKKARVLGMGEWFIPGGKIEPGEAADVACCREIREELGAGVHVESLVSLPIVEGSPVPPGPKGLFLMRPFLVRSWGTIPSCTVDGDVRLRWVPIAEALDSPVPQVRMMVAAARAAEGSANG